MRILLWHGYLLSGTGSNIYTRALARAWSRIGHEVVVLCQDPHPERYDLGGARVVRPDIGGVLPVFVLDRYEGLEGARRRPPGGPPRLGGRALRLGGAGAGGGAVAEGGARGPAEPRERPGA